MVPIIVADDPPPGGVALLVDGDQPQQRAEHLAAAAPTSMGSRSEGSVSLLDERATYSTKLVVTFK